jgi:DNA-cytosine methyltransferase
MFNEVSNKFTVAEVFCGCGGLSHGFARSGKFDVVFGNDVKKAALNSFKLNHSGKFGEPGVINGDIREVSTKEIELALARQGVGFEELDCLVGGPPCQGFSQMRRSQERQKNNLVKFGGYNRLDQDSRNDLVLRFLEVASVLRPKFILIENVPQMKTHGRDGKTTSVMESVESVLREMGYNADHVVVNAANYGVPQLRERLIILASRVSSISFPKATHSDPSILSAENSHLLPWTTVADAISDLPEPARGPNDSLGGSSLSTYLKIELTDYARKMRGAKIFPYNHLTRKYGHDIIKTIKEMQPGETWDAASDRKKRDYEPLIAVLTGEGKTSSEAIEILAKQGLVNSKFFKKYYWSAYTRLAWEKPALTITANANFLGSGRFTHPKENRGITMREAARLQSFDDDFKFVTSAKDDDETNNIGIGLDMIGEAVPPLLAEAFANHIATQLDSNRVLKRVVKEQKATARPEAINA